MIPWATAGLDRWLSRQNPAYRPVLQKAPLFRAVLFRFQDFWCKKSHLCVIIIRIATNLVVNAYQTVGNFANSTQHKTAQSSNEEVKTGNRYKQNDAHNSLIGNDHSDHGQDAPQNIEYALNIGNNLHHIHNGFRNIVILDSYMLKYYAIIKFVLLQNKSNQ